MRFKSKSTAGLVLASVLVLIIAGEVRRNTAETRTERQVYFWIRSMEWWDHGQTEEGNQMRLVRELRVLGPSGVKILERDLRFRPVRFEAARKIPILRKLFSTSNPAEEPQDIRHRAAYYLGALGSDARSAVLSLLELVDDPDDRVRFEVAFALGRIGVDTPEVRAVLEKLLAATSQDVKFSAAISLWSFDRENNEAIRRVENLITPNYISWPSICLIKLGSNAVVFAPRLKQALQESPKPLSRIQAIHAVWAMTRDKEFVFQKLAAITRALENPVSDKQAPGFTHAEDLAGYVVHSFDDEPEFRERMRLMLRAILNTPGSNAQPMARVYLQRFDELDRRQSEADASKQNGP